LIRARFLHEIVRFVDDGAAFGSAGDGDAAAASELKPIRTFGVESRRP
jgi:hypothetical protein